MFFFLLLLVLSSLCPVTFEILHGQIFGFNYTTKFGDPPSPSPIFDPFNPPVLYMEYH